ncbi:fetuin-B-like [Thamnophis elegans]|uniref:fetuin-B-like n=1 Tax=Thamnophis elegans TaxID=35005 RepID=UPI00137708F9|nr:fetuin-B-like [Thamnophis elegans]XP_032081642.1 fetuin-B-like [Thamnophis elegans]
MYISLFEAQLIGMEDKIATPQLFYSPGLQKKIIYTLAASTAPSFVYPSCNFLVVKAAAEVALDQVNSNRKEGYVFGLQRIFDVRDLPQKNGDSLFYLTLDVVETDCHILSGKKWKECKFPTDHGAVHGQCKVVLQYNGKSKNSFMYRYSCSLRTVSSSAISRLCPDCPRRGNPSEESYQETAKRTLAKFNAEINHTHYFGLVKVTKAMAWWVSGASEEVEYTIQETSCRKNSRVPDITKCPFLPIENAERGLCKGSVINKGMALQEKVYVKCNFFPRPKRQSPYSVMQFVQTIPPFPKEFSGSSKCPGDVLADVNGLQLPSPPKA